MAQCARMITETQKQGSPMATCQIVRGRLPCWSSSCQLWRAGEVQVLGGLQPVEQKCKRKRVTGEALASGVITPRDLSSAAQGSVSGLSRPVHQCYGLTN